MVEVEYYRNRDSCEVCCCKCIVYKTTKFQFIVSPRPIWNPLVESCADFNMGTEYVTSIRAVGAKVTEKPLLLPNAAHTTFQSHYEYQRQSEPS